jgi:hypothetical protein
MTRDNEQRERRETLPNDQRGVREQGSTFLAHTNSDAGGRFATVGAATVIGSTAVPQYPQASAPFQRDPVPDEPPLGFDNPDLEPPSSSAQATDPTSADAPSLTALDDVERADVGPLSHDPPAFRRF